MLRNKRFAQAAATVAGLAMTLSMTAPASATTVADLQAQISALMAQLSSLQGGTACAVFTGDLTVGSRGTEVVALQQMLIAKGFLTVPAGTALGYFGGLTRAAVVHWQISAGITPSLGYFGPKSRAVANVCASTGGTTTGGTTTGGTTGGTVSGTITTPGAEGTLTVTTAPVSNTTLYENDSQVPVIAFNAKATGSDIAIQRVKVDLGTNTNLTNKVFANLYVKDDAGHVLASLATNSTNVVKDSDNHYYATLSGFSSVVSRGTQRTFTVAADLRSSIDSTYRTSYTSLQIPANGVRGVDGAGIDLYGPTTAITSSFTVSASLATSAQLTVSTDGNTPLKQQVIAANGANNNQLDKQPLLVFDIRADKDAVKITDINSLSVTSSGGTGATASTTYLYAGNGTSGQLLGTAALTVATANFNNISYTIPAGTTQSFTVAADIRNANSAATTFTASLTGNSTNVVGTNSAGDTVTNVTGSATGNAIIVLNVGPVFSLTGTPTISRNAGTSGIANGTSTLSASFTVHAMAVGGDVIFGTQSASSTFGIGVYKGGVLTTILAASSTSFTIPSSGVVTSGLAATGQAFKLQQNNSVDIPVSFIMDGRTAAGALIGTDNYAVGIESITWSSTTSVPVTSTFMAGQTAWRTAAVAMP